ncbi:MAG TPA: transposase [Acidimicrobiia bacterium]|nr:transposase [Acidimicrobiia bacterium]
MQVNTNPVRVSIGIDAAVVAAHQVAVRGEVREDFKIRSTLAGLAELTGRLEPYAGAMVVAEPTAGTWLPLAHAVTDAGCGIGFVANRDSARLRTAIAGASKTDVIDADMLAHCEEILGVDPAPVPPSGQIALRRAMRRRHIATVDAHRAETRLWALAAWAFPDLWRATGGHTLAQPLLARWPHLEGLSRARRSSIADLVAGSSRDKDPQRRAERIRDTAAGWARFWEGRLDLDALAWEVSAMLDDIAAADQRQTDATRQATGLWRRHWPDDPLITIPGMGPVCSSAVRGWWGDATQFPTAKTAVAHTGLNPSMWSSGLTESPSRRITKQGPAELRLALYQAANVARRHDPQLAEHYRRLMVERGHNHISANTAIARKLACRAWAIATTGRAYQPQDLNGNPISYAQATALAAELAVDDETRGRRRGHSRRGRLNPT